MDKLILEKTNCIVNLLEISYPKAEEITIDGKKQYKTEDLSVYQYFLKYKNTAGGEVSETEKYILSDMSGFKINDNGEVTCSFAEASNVASHSPIPVIVFTLQDDTGSVKASLDRSYEETDEEHTLTVKKLLQSLNAMGFQLQDEQFMMILGQFRILELTL